MHPSLRSPLSKSRILVVEDEIIIARDIQMLLVELGYNPVGHATQGEQAIALAGELRPDLVLMDIQLAGTMDGITAAQVIQERYALPVVFVSAFGESVTSPGGERANPSRYFVSKPLFGNDLGRVIDAALKQLPQ